MSIETVARPAHTQAQMLADLRATYPKLKAVPLGDWAGPEWESSGGIRVACDDDVLMPDGLPIITSSSWISQEYEEFDGPMHSAFWSWLDVRGWYYENYDGMTLFLLPASLIPEYEPAPPPAGWKPLADGESPF